MGAEDELAALREEVAALRAEVALLRAQQVPAYVPQPWQPQPLFGPGPVVWQSPLNMCAGASPMAQTGFVNTAAANPVTFELPLSTFGAAGCAGGYAGQVYTVPAG